ncbi:MAG: hypothetical protein ACJAZS_000250 [Alteromonas naphthalenivorans]|jgi:hypothetical protein
MFNSPFWWQLYIFRWQDAVEVLAFSGGVFYLSTWLRKDTSTPLLGIFYGYCTFFLATYYFQLLTLSTALLTFAPITIAVCLMLHQSTLQKNFIALHAIAPKKTTSNWVDLLMRSSLVALGENKPVTVLIEKTQALDTLLSSDYPFDCVLSEGLFQVLIGSSAFCADEMLWVSNSGKLRAINSQWKKSSVDEWLAQEVKEQEQWLQDALFFTSKTDAIFFKLHPKSRTFTLVAQGKILQHASAHAALRMIKKYLGLTAQDKGNDYAHIQKTSSSEQSLS